MMKIIPPLAEHTMQAGAWHCRRNRKNAAIVRKTWRINYGYFNCKTRNIHL